MNTETVKKEVTIYLLQSAYETFEKEVRDSTPEQFMESVLTQKAYEIKEGVATPKNDAVGIDEILKNIPHDCVIPNTFQVAYGEEKVKQAMEQYALQFTTPAKEAGTDAVADVPKPTHP